MLRPGQAVDRYIVEEELGHGGMATVYRVRHGSLGSLHALKVLRVEIPAVRRRLLQEGRTQASLRHPNVVSVTDVVEIEGLPALVLEFVPGPSLDAWLKTNRPTLEEAERLFRQILAGVGLAHRQGLVHRDLKPANILLDPSGGAHVAKVADFGLVKMLHDDAPLWTTRTGATLGTPAYMAPEQIRDAKGVDARADVFALGCILYELVCGRPAFVGEDMLSIFNAVVDGRFEPPERIVPDLPERFGAAIRGCLATSPSARIPDCEELARVLAGGVATAPSPTSSTLAPSADVVLALPGATIVPDGTLHGSAPTASLDRPRPTRAFPVALLAVGLTLGAAGGAALLVAGVLAWNASTPTIDAPGPVPAAPPPASAPTTAASSAPSAPSAASTPSAQPGPTGSDRGRTRSGGEERSERGKDREEKKRDEEEKKEEKKRKERGKDERKGD